MDIYFRYIMNAVVTINVKSSKIMENNFYYYRNRVIDLATSKFICETHSKLVDVRYNHYDRNAPTTTKLIMGNVHPTTEARIKREIKLKLYENNDYLKSMIFTNYRLAREEYLEEQLKEDD